MLNILWYIIVGFLAGLVARAILPGADHMGFFATTAVGIVGGILGGLIGDRFSKTPSAAKFRPAGFIMSVIGAVILLIVLRLLR
ncbi:MAG TPA: GlsB/YeaQ/YmgE family stress response membrane protein [candidate division Zixibacteria bacterium]|nr:GlsB/YeaQ/YmgE family stress response membrane protein [candidate division Zixibacteria bacterium]MDD4917151.1 GlsB/YeaQ/YmgE family stress response membrane protein [candidate division Zixibacteria bacterium]MDM7972665.1 GlsB/YeaQ/YmgE family stress response membrane protein [candidate division Zixibacteria bacterium]HOD65419.1 GlsB/YeaQ/YmgE family stress response membrane protein [candidate division Zixibacteria bacterium]HOZ07647.1 GlsB/YeaQ/YmgE family stress response membrane protein [